MALIDSDTGLSGANEVQPSSAQSRSTLGAGAIGVYRPPLPSTSKIEAAAEEEPTIKIGSLVTLFIISKLKEFKIYISDDSRDIGQLMPQIQALFTNDKVIIIPYNDSPKHKQMNLAQLLVGKNEGDTVTLLNGDKAEIKKIVDIDNLG